MKKIYIKKWMIALLLLLVGIVGLFVCYQSFYNPAMDECEKTEKSIETLKTSIEAAKTNLEQQSYYTTETEMLVAKTEKLMDSIHFPGEILEEDQILYIQDVEKDTEQKQTTISFGTNSSLFSSGVFTLQEKTFPFTYTATYEGMKNLINYFVQNEEDPVSLVSLTISYDAETDTCTGTMILRRYFVTGIEEYQPPVIPGVQIGTDNILG